MASKEDHIHQLNKEICDWRLKYQDMCDVELEKKSLSSKLNSITNEKHFLQDAQSTMMVQIGRLNDKTTALEADLHKLRSENKALQERIEEGSAAIKMSADVEEKDVEMQGLREEMSEWKANKEMLVAELEKVLNEKDKTIKRLTAATGNPDEELSLKVAKLDKRVARKDKIILQLEQKIRAQATTIQDLVIVSERPSRAPRTRRRSSSGSTKTVNEDLQSAESDLRLEQANHIGTQAMLDRVLNAKDEQVADLKEANTKLQHEIERLDLVIRSKTPYRPSDRFKEPNFTNDNDLSGSTMELDVTPMSSSKKRSTKKPTRKSTRTSAGRSAQKENTNPSSSRPSTLKRIQDMVEKSTSPLASPVKKLFNVRLTPLKDDGSVSVKPSAPTTSSATTGPEESAPRTRRRRKLYTVTENTLTAATTPPSEDAGASSSKRTRSSVHSIVSNRLRSMQPK